MKHYNRKDVQDFNEYIRIDERAIAHVTSINADILREILDRLDMIDVKIKAIERKDGVWL